MPPPIPWPERRTTPWLMAAVIVGLVLACYGPALHGGLLWDDQAHVTRPDLRSLSGLARIWTDIHATQQYYPVLHSAFWLEHRLWGDATLGYHLANVLEHAASCLLLALVLRRLMNSGRVQPLDKPGAQPNPSGRIGARSVAAEVTRRLHANHDPSRLLTSAATPNCPAPAQDPELVEGPRLDPISAKSVVAWIAALLFAVHPVGVESVAWISEQKNTLSLLFYLLAVHAYLDFDARRSRWAYLRATVLFLLAVGTKTVTVTLPAALLVILAWRHGRLRWRRDVAPLLPWLVIGVAAGLFTAWDERTLMGAHGAAYNLTLPQRALLAGRIIWFYLGKLVWPADLTFIYPRWDVAASAAAWSGWAAATVALTVALWLARSRATTAPTRTAASAGLAGWLLFVGTLFPALGFFNVFPFQYSYVADHFQYHASLGIVVVAAAGLAWTIGAPAAFVRAAGRSLTVLLVAGLAVLSHLQSQLYRDGETLYRSTIARNPACWMAYNNLGADLSARSGRAAEARADFEQALRIRPDYPEAHNNLGSLLAKLPGGGPAALAEYEAALRLKPDFSEAHDNLANLLATLPGRAADALAHHRRALQIDSGNVDAHFNYAAFLATLPGRDAEAIAEYRVTLRLDPRQFEALNNLAVLYARQGRFDDAKRCWEQALQINPHYGDARTNLERLNERLGR